MTEPVEPAITDRRTITFSADTVGAAYAVHLARMGDATFRRVTRVGLQPGQSHVMLKVEGGSVVEDRMVDLETLGSALIFYCVDVRIPLPRKARRRISVTENAVVLTVEMVFQEPPSRKPPPEPVPAMAGARGMRW